MDTNWILTISRILRKPITTKVFGISVTMPLFVVAVILLSITGFFLGRYRLNQGKWHTLVSKQYEYSIDYPANWLMYTHGDRGSRGSNYLRADFGNFLTSTYVMIHEQAMEGATLMKAAEWSEEIIERQGGYNWSELEEVEIGRENYPALVRTYVEDDFLGQHILNKAVYIVTNERGFMLQFSTYERRHNKSVVIFDNMLNSFQLLETTEE